jgi:ferritin-like metal-binding protein YciE
MSNKDLVISWLNDAHSMENSLIQVLEHRVKDAKDYPQLQARDQQHLEETRRHAELVKGCVERLGGSVSGIKSMMATIFGQVQAPMTGLAQDEIVKNCLTDYAAEQFEVASYTALIAAATQGGDMETVTVCQQILREDQAMSDFILQNLPMVVQNHLRETATANA